ncbi:hypothetical protein [Altererythrobacter sp. ZODW24]|uniref:hypothetical protein n=1 Tax=Altererythrobacter sp. ZODW24 TaxID=2185142 RepID=UPI000DF8300C|nr:hypothetical protein [Altererythrobacter sp. ZODW24]
MPKFALIYRNANPPSSPEEGQSHMEKWRAWSAGLGSALIEPGMPFSQAVTVSKDGITKVGDEAALNGISIVEAATCEEAGAMAQSCPHLNLGGDIIVAEGMDMEM